MPADPTRPPTSAEQPALPASADLEDLLNIPPAARAAWLRVLLAAGGLLLVALGVVGWLVPIVTGIPFYLLGFVLLGMSHPPLGRWINRKERGLPPRVRLALRPRVRAAWKRGEVRFGGASDGRAGGGPPVEDGRSDDPRGAGASPTRPDPGSA